MPDEPGRAARLRNTALVVWTTVGMLLLVAAGGWLLGRIMPALIPFILAGIIAFLLHVPVNYLEQREMSRGWAVILCFVVGVGILAIVGVFLAPPLARQVQAFADAVPDYLNSAQRLLVSLQKSYSDVIVPEWLRNTVSTAANDVGRLATRLAESAGNLVLAAGTGVVTGLVDIFLALVIAFWLLKDLPVIKGELEALAGPRFEDDVEVLVRTVERVVGGYLKGATIASFTTAVLATIGFAIVGVPYALVLGMFAFVLNYVPYVGPLVTALIAATVGLFVSPLTAVLAAAVVFGAQIFTDNLVTPKVMSAQVNLHPTLVIFSLLVGATLWGIAGMILAIPVAAAIQGMFVYYYERRTRRPLATEEGALFKSSPCPPDEEPCPEETPEATSESPPSSE